MANQCPVCGYSKLAEPPRSPSGGASYEICPSCGFQFGVSDDDAGFSYESWRELWRQGGMRWVSQGRPAPADWNPATQLGNLSGKPARRPKSSPRTPAKHPRRKA